MCGRGDKAQLHGLVGLVEKLRHQAASSHAGHPFSKNKERKGHGNALGNSFARRRASWKAIPPQALGSGEDACCKAKAPVLAHVGLYSPPAVAEFPVARTVDLSAAETGRAEERLRVILRVGRRVYARITS